MALKRLLAFAAFAIFLFAPGDRLQSAPPGDLYTTAMYRHAFTNSSTSPDYILITVKDGRTGASVVTCTISNFLLGALEIEHGLPYDRSEKMALHNADRTFVFSNPKALDNLPRYYSDAMLDEMRKEIGSKTDNDLLTTHFVQTLYLQKGKNYQAYLDACAQVLLERGISCVQEDRTGGLRLYK